MKTHFRSLMPPSGAELTIQTAEKVFGWKNVHDHEGQLVGKKQDKLGRWRSARVPDYSGDPGQSYEIDERMKELGRWDQYMRELGRLTKSNSLPREWATPEQRSRAAIKVVTIKRIKWRSLESSGPVRSMDYNNLQP